MRLRFVVLALACGLAPGAASAQIAQKPRELENVGVREHLDQPIPLDTRFRDHTGAPVRLGQYFDGKRPVLLTIAYHTCPVLCSMVLSKATESLGKIGWTIGKEYDAVTLSMDPNESLERTAAKRASLLSTYGRPEAERGWHFLVGDDAAIHAVTDAVGYDFHYDAVDKQFAHPAVVMLVKPDGHMARYLYGLEYAPNDLKLGLLEASEGRSISTVEQVIMYCYRYDPDSRSYTLMATRVMRIGGAATALVLGGFLAALWRRERQKSRQRPEGGADPGAQSPGSGSSSVEGTGPSKSRGVAERRRDGQALRAAPGSAGE